MALLTFLEYICNAKCENKGRQIMIDKAVYKKEKKKREHSVSNGCEINVRIDCVARTAIAFRHIEQSWACEAVDAADVIFRNRL